MTEKIKKLDLRGEICPYTFVKSKLALEKTKSGNVLEIIFDYEPATKNVPRSFDYEGHKILKVKKTKEKEWVVRVRKK